MGDLLGSLVWGAKSGQYCVIGGGSLHLHFEILTVKGGIFLGFLPISVRINGINRRMGPKNQKVVVWEVRVKMLVVQDAIQRKGGSLRG
jgi:hypothetical protein